MSSSPGESSLQSVPSLVEPLREAVAANVRHARLVRGLSLRDLSQRTGTSKALLSQLERCVANPTIDVLARVASALDLSVSDLLRTHLSAPEVIRRDEGPALQLQDVSIRTLFAISDRRRLDVSEGTLPPHTRSSRSEHGRASIEYAYVVEGVVTVSSLDWSVELTAGDSVRFSAEAEHVYSTGRRAARVLTFVGMADD